MQRPNILEYENYRAYLKDWYAWMKASKPGFSYRAFSQWASFKSPNQLQLIILGKRNITPATLGIFTTILKLRKREKRYFELLVAINQATTPHEKAGYVQELSDYFKKYNELKHHQFEYLLKWYLPVVRELATTKGFKPERHALARRIGHGITPRNVDEALEKLIALGLLKKEGNSLVQADAIVSTGPETGSAAAYFYHDQMIRLALEALQQHMPHERNFSGITFACRREDVQEIAELLDQCRHQILAYLENRGKVEDDEVYQLNLQCFRVTKGKEGS